MKRATLIFAALAVAFTSTAAPVRTATESYVTNKIAEAVAPLASTNDVAAAAQAATNYTDNATNALAEALRENSSNLVEMVELRATKQRLGAPQLTTNDVWVCWDGTLLHHDPEHSFDNPIATGWYWSGTNTAASCWQYPDATSIDLAFRRIKGSGEGSWECEVMYISGEHAGQYAAYPVIYEGQPDGVILSVLAATPSGADATAIDFGEDYPEDGISIHLPIIRRSSAEVVYSDDIPDWAKAAQKPTYTASEVGALPAVLDGDSLEVPDSKEIHFWGDVYLYEYVNCKGGVGMGYGVGGIFPDSPNVYAFDFTGRTPGTFTNITSRLVPDGSNVITSNLLAAAVANYKPLQAAKSSPSAASTEAYQFIDTVSQDTNGVITATKKTMRKATTSAPGMVQLNDNIDSTRTDHAATANAVRRVAEDLAELRATNAVEMAGLRSDTATNAVEIAELRSALIGAIEYIVSPQTARGTVYTGVSQDTELRDGKVIYYYMPYQASGNWTLNLQLADGTWTGAKPTYYWGTSQISTRYGANSIVPLVYRNGAWYCSDYDANSNNYDRNIVTYCRAAAALAGNVLCVGTTNGYVKVSTNVTFDVHLPILFNTTAQAAGKTNGNYWYSNLTGINLGTTWSGWAGDATTRRRPVFLVGSYNADEETFTIDDECPFSLDPVRPCIPLGWYNANADSSFCFLPGPLLLDVVTPEDVTAAIREQSLGGIWDEALQVWWTPVMDNGLLTYQATTNVNLNVEE